MNQDATPPRATGRSMQFSLEEAVSNAASQLPRLPGADREDHVRIVSLEAEIGGIIGGRRLVVTVERIEGGEG